MASAPDTTAHGELAEVLESETHVDMEKLLSLCRHGVPERLRPEAWKYLLGVSRPERSEELTLGKRMEQEYLELCKAWQAHQQSDLSRSVRGDVRKHRSDLEKFCDPWMRQRLENVLRCYLHAQGEDYRPGIVHLLGPLAQVYSSEVEIYFTFQELMKRLVWSMSFDGCKQMTVTFMTLLRHTLPELYLFLEEEQCAGGSWLTSWLQARAARDTRCRAVSPGLPWLGRWPIHCPSIADCSPPTSRRAFQPPAPSTARVCPAATDATLTRIATRVRPPIVGHVPRLPHVARE